LLINASGVPRDCAEGLRLAWLAVNDSAPIGQTVLGHAYNFGTCVKQDYHAARKWYEVAAAKGSTPARVNLAVMQMRGLGGFTGDYRAAEVLFLAAAFDGDEIARANLSALQANALQGIFSVSTKSPNQRTSYR